MEMSKYQSLKMHLLEIIPISKDAFHVYIGFTVFALAFLLLKSRFKTFILIIPSIIISMLMETFDLRDDFRSTGECQWWESLHDIVNTNLIPFILTIWLYIKERKLRGR